MGREIISLKTPISELTVSMQVCRIIVVSRTNVTWNIAHLLLCSCRLLAFLNLELHRTFFARIGNGLTSFWLDKSMPIKMMMSQACMHVKTHPIKKAPTSQMVIYSWNDFPCSHTWLHFLICSGFRWSLFFCCVLLIYFSEKGKRKLLQSRFFLPLELWTNLKTVQCVQYLIQMYLPCLAINQILL